MTAPQPTPPAAIAPPPPLSAFLLTLGLVGLAGFVDAISYLKLSGTYVSFMSGNTTTLGTATATGKTDKAVHTAEVIGLFLAGVLLGTWLAAAVGRRHAPVVLGVVAVLLLGAYLWPPGLLAGMALAMGMLNSTLHKIGKTSFSLTFVTGALVRFGTGLAQWISGREAEPGWGWMGGSWLGFLLGALTGAAVFDAFGLLALLVAAVTTGLACIGSSFFEESMN